MGDYQSQSRKTDTAKNLEEFLDGFTHSDFSYGFDSVVASLEDVAEKVDEDATDLEQRIDELEDALRDAKDSIAELEKERDELQDQIDAGFEVIRP